MNQKPRLDYRNLDGFFGAGADRRHHPRKQPLTTPTDKDAVLQLNGFGVAFGSKVVLCEISFSIAQTGSVVLLGPSGTGKSTLLRTLVGLSSANPSFRTWGDVFYLGSRLGEQERPELVAQSAKLMMSSVMENVVINLPERNVLTKVMQRDLVLRLLERAGLEELCDKLDLPVVQLPLAVQRHLAILRQVVAGPKLLCIDEPTTGLNEAESTRLLSYMREESTRRALLVALHNQEHARQLQGKAILIAGGYVQEEQSIPSIFESPVSSAGQQFARNGTCHVASPGTPHEELDESVPRPPALPKEALNFSGTSGGPRGFLWLRKGLLAGTPLPGVYFDMEYDLDLLKKVGITRLITLTETALEETRLAPFGMQSIWEPIQDMEAPTIEQGTRICQKIDELLDEQQVIAVHCKAGMGRTGTILAAHLIWHGFDGLEALETVRNIEPRWVQSQAQVDFLEEFSRSLNKNH